LALLLFASTSSGEMIIEIEICPPLGEFHAIPPRMHQASIVEINLQPLCLRRGLEIIQGLKIDFNKLRELKLPNTAPRGEKMVPKRDLDAEVVSS